MGSVSTKIARGWWRPAKDSEKHVSGAKSISAPDALSALRVPSGRIPCSWQRRRHVSEPIWQPAWPTWMLMHSPHAREDMRYCAAGARKWVGSRQTQQTLLKRTCSMTSPLGPPGLKVLTRCEQGVIGSPINKNKPLRTNHSSPGRTGVLQVLKMLASWGRTRSQ